QTTLWTWKCLVRARRHCVRAFMHRVLELSTSDQSGNVSRIIANTCVVIMEHLGEVLYRLREREDAASEHTQGHLLPIGHQLLHFLRGGVDVNVHLVHIEREILHVQSTNRSSCSAKILPSHADVPACGDC